MRTTFLLLWLLFVGHKVKAKTDFELQFENFSCSSDAGAAHLMERYQCGLNKNTKRRTINLEFMLKKTLNEHDFNMVIVLPRTVGDFVLLNVSTDGCAALSNRNQLPLVRMGRNIMDRYSNFPKKCPFEQGKLYYIRGFRFDVSVVPGMNMETPIRVQFGYLIDRFSVLKAYITGRVLLKSQNKRNPIGL